MSPSIAQRLFEDDSVDFYSPVKHLDDTAANDINSSLTVDNFPVMSAACVFAEDEDSRDSGIGLDDSFVQDDIIHCLTSRSFEQFSKKEKCEPVIYESNRKRARPDSDEDDSPVQKRNRLTSGFPGSGKCPLTTTQAKSQDAIKSALDRVAENPDLISDGSLPYCLPTIPGKHQDLKSITPDTLARVLRNEFEDTVDQFLVVDCRYPYEYVGGHIKGAVNYHTKDAIVENLISTPFGKTDSVKRTVLIFHCEFSSERGPKMCRFLRSQDRVMNKDRYPELCYPEIYLLHGGYKNFFENKKDMCTPEGYLPMHHEDYKKDMRKFRRQSKSWAGESKSRSRLFF